MHWRRIPFRTNTERLEIDTFCAAIVEHGTENGRSFRRTVFRAVSYSTEYGTREVSTKQNGTAYGIRDDKYGTEYGTEDDMPKKIPRVRERSASDDAVLMFFH